MKNRYVFLLAASAVAAAVFLPHNAHGQSTAPAPTQGVLGILQHGNWQCALPGDAGSAAFVGLPDESFRISTASSYDSNAGSGIYLMRGNEVIFTRGPKKDQRFRRLGDNTLQKLGPDGSLTKMICTRLG